jgi:hypothetical protein
MTEKSRRVRKEGKTLRDAPPLVPGLLLDPDFDSLYESDVVPAELIETRNGAETF